METNSSALTAVLVGCGDISRIWLRSCSGMEDLRVAGLMDLDLSRAEAQVDKFGIAAAQVGVDLEEMLAAVKPDIVFNCTVPAAHHSVTLAAFRAGCHVLGEKPMAANLAEAREMIAAARDAGRLFAVTQNRRFLPAIRGVRQFLETGKIGPVTEMHADFFVAPHYEGFRRTMRHVLLSDMAIHTFDSARFLSGADAVSVYAEDWTPAGSHFEHGASVLASFEMSDGNRFTYRGSWADEGFRTSWESDWRIVGQNGTVRWDGSPEILVETIRSKEGFISKFDSVKETVATQTGPEGHEAIIREFLDCVRTGKTPSTHGGDNFKTFAMAQAAIESAECGRRVPVPRE